MLKIYSWEILLNIVTNTDENVYSSSHKQQVLGGCYALILPYFCHESNLLFSGNMICKKMRNIVCLVERNPMQPEEAGNSSVTL